MLTDASSGVAASSWVRTRAATSARQRSLSVITALWQAPARECERAASRLATEHAGLAPCQSALGSQPTSGSRGHRGPCIASSWATGVHGSAGGPLMGAEAAPDTGTTIVAVSYRDGVVIGADSRVSTGAYVSNRASVSTTHLPPRGRAQPRWPHQEGRSQDKLTALHDTVWLLRSGSAADTQLVADYGAAPPHRPQSPRALRAPQARRAAQCATTPPSTPWSWTSPRMCRPWPTWSSWCVRRGRCR